MSRRLQIIVTDRQYDYLNEASERTSLSMSELVRRALDTKYPAAGADVPAWSQFTMAVWRRPRELGTGRRPGLRLD